MQMFPPFLLLSGGTTRSNLLFYDEPEFQFSWLNHRCKYLNLILTLPLRPYLEMIGFC
jgi:hypothetical protein